MNDEIKETLHLLKRCDNTYLKIENSNGEKKYEYHQVNDLRLDGYHSQLLLDYITNLQEENERLNTELNAYKSRCEKANEYIKENKDKYYHDWGEDDGSYDTYLDETEIDKLSNILNGGDE